MSKIREYSNVELQEIASGALLPAKNKLRVMELTSGPSKLLPDRSLVSKAIEEFDEEGRINSECHMTLEEDAVRKLFTETEIKTLFDEITKILVEDLKKVPTEMRANGHVPKYVLFDSLGCGVRKEMVELSAKSCGLLKEAIDNWLQLHAETSTEPSVAVIFDENDPGRVTINIEHKRKGDTDETHQTKT